jgi:AcrR family transcriptional regulator
MSTERNTVAKFRREQIVEAAMAIIAEEGLQNLSLSAIETRADMSRGQLTYYFPAKEDILLAVFDRLLQMMHDQAQSGEGPCSLAGEGWDRVRQLLEMFLLHPPPAQVFHALQYTFLSQISHRDDFRARLANLYEDWRAHMASDVAGELASAERPVSPRTFASLVQAILHGLAMQRVADPNAFDSREMLELCIQLLGTYLRPVAAKEPLSSRNGDNRPLKPQLQAARKRQL